MIPRESPKKTQTAKALQESPKGPQDSPGARRRPKSAPQEALETQQTPMLFWFVLMLENCSRFANPHQPILKQPL